MPGIELQLGSATGNGLKENKDLQVSGTETWTVTSVYGTSPSATISRSNTNVTLSATTVSTNSGTFTITGASTGAYIVDITQTIPGSGKAPTVYYRGRISGNISSPGAGVTAPAIGSVTHNNAAASSVTATVNLSSSGSGGTLQYAQTTSNSAPSSGWQSGSTFSHPRGATRYYWARRSTTTVSSSASLTVAAVSYTLTAPTSINEGNSGTCNISTVGVPTNTTLYWEVQPSADFSTHQGSATIFSNAASFTLTPSADSSTEGAETATVVLYTDSSRTNNVASDTFTINDTSTGGGSGGGGSTPSYSLGTVSNMNEGASQTVSVSTSNVSNGTTLYWSINGSGDFTAHSGSFTISSNAGSFTISSIGDQTTEGTETKTLSLHTGSASGTQVDSTTFSLLDTSTASGGGSGGGGAGTGGSSTGTASYGLAVYDPNGNTVVFGTNLRTQNIVFTTTQSAVSGTTYGPFTVANANDTSKVQILAEYNNPTGSSQTVSGSDIVLKKTSTGFSFKHTAGGTKTFVLTAIQIA